MEDRSAERTHMVRHQVAARGIRDERVLGALREVPREAFMREDLAEFAYDDTALPIEAGQTISQPYIVAVMIEALRTRPEDPPALVPTIGFKRLTESADSYNIGIHRRVHGSAQGSEGRKLSRVHFAG